MSYREADSEGLSHGASSSACSFCCCNLAARDAAIASETSSLHQSRPETVCQSNQLSYRHFTSIGKQPFCLGFIVFAVQCRKAAAMPKMKQGS